MNLTVKLFGPYADAVGDTSVNIVMSKAVKPTAEQVINRIAKQWPRLNAMLPAGMLAVNHQCVSPSHPVKQGDELAIIGLVSGG